MESIVPKAHPYTKQEACQAGGVDHQKRRGTIWL